MVTFYEKPWMTQDSRTKIQRVEQRATEKSKTAEPNPNHRTGIQIGRNSTSGTASSRAPSAPVAESDDEILVFNLIL
ncbi:hypothetical protein H8959_015515 [Pygathrix nigripes]